MTDVVPSGAFNDARDREQEIATKTLGAKKQAFDSRASSLTAMRTAVNDHETRIDKIEEVLRDRPF